MSLHPTIKGTARHHLAIINIIVDNCQMTN